MKGHELAHKFTIYLISMFVFGSIFWLLWTCAGYGVRYFSFLPEPWPDMPFSDCIGLTYLVAIVRVIIGPIIKVINDVQVSVPDEDE